MEASSPQAILATNLHHPGLEEIKHIILVFDQIYRQVLVFPTIFLSLISRHSSVIFSSQLGFYTRFLGVCRPFQVFLNIRIPCGALSVISHTFLHSLQCRSEF
jgi:hypothetical protein